MLYGGLQPALYSVGLIAEPTFFLLLYVVPQFVKCLMDSVNLEFLFWVSSVVSGRLVELDFLGDLFVKLLMTLKGILGKVTEFYPLGLLLLFGQLCDFHLPIAYQIVLCVFALQILHFYVFEEVVLVVSVYGQEARVFPDSHSVLEVRVLVIYMLVDRRAIDVLFQAVIDQMAHLLLVIDNGLVETRLAREHKLNLVDAIPDVNHYTADIAQIHIALRQVKGSCV